MWQFDSLLYMVAPAFSMSIPVSLMKVALEVVALEFMQCSLLRFSEETQTHPDSRVELSGFTLMGK